MSACLEARKCAALLFGLGQVGQEQDSGVTMSKTSDIQIDPFKSLLVILVDIRP